VDISDVKSVSLHTTNSPEINFLADRTACIMFDYWHTNVVMYVCPSICDIVQCAVWLNDTCYSKSDWTSE